MKLKPLIESKMYISDEDFLPNSTLTNFFEKHTTLRGDQISQHILKIVSTFNHPTHCLSGRVIAKERPPPPQRSKAWEICPYPCIGNFYFVEFTFANQPGYPEALRKLKQGGSLLDVGCCFGQDLRKLVADGAPAANLYGIDLRPEFAELGYELFLDRETFLAHFIAPVDILLLGEGCTANDKTVRPLDGKMDIIHLGYFLHLFNWQDQVRASKNIAKFLSPAKDSLIVGHQVGSGVSGEFATPWTGLEEDSAFKHNEASFKQLWEQVPGEWEVKFDFVSRPRSLGKDPRDMLFADSDSHRQLFTFTIRRV